MPLGFPPPPRLRNVNLIFVGRLYDNKNLLAVLNLFPQFADKVSRFTIIGEGPNLEKVIAFANSNPKICYLGTLSNYETKQYISKHDLLILPSHYDGWGAVINEALSVGTRVICSKNCGAEVLLDGLQRGEAFSFSNMLDIIDKWIGKGHLSMMERMQIKSWADKHISGEIAAQYFVDSFKEGVNLKAPWMM